MKLWHFAFWTLIAACLGATCLNEDGSSSGTDQTSGGSEGIPTTSQPAPISGPQYSASLLDPLHESTAGAKAVAVGDIDNDGLLDVASISDESEPVQIHLRTDVAGDFDTITIAGGAPLTFSADMELADLNGDGKLDIVVLVRDTGFASGDGDSSSGALVLLIQGADPRNPSDWTHLPQAGTSPPDNLAFPGGEVGPADLAIGQVDGLNGPDIVVLSNEAEYRYVHLFANPGPANVTTAAAWTSAVIETDIVDLAKTELADLDGDGDLDVVMSAPAAKSFNLRWLQNPLVQDEVDDASTVPTFAEDQIDPLLEATAGATATAVGNIDDNDSIDVVSIHDESQPVQVHLWDTDAGSFDTISIAGNAPLCALLDVELADLNRDGKLDIVVLADNTLCQGAGALILLVQGDDPRDPGDWTWVPDPGTSVPENMSFPQGQVADLVVGDLDGMNGPDIVVASSSEVRLFANPGDAESTDETAWVSTVIEDWVHGPAGVKLTDLDDDGDQDVVMCDPGAPTWDLRWLQNPQVEADTDEESPVPTYMSDLVDPLLESTAGAKAVSIGDIDGDGELDVASVSDENQPVQIHLFNTATGKFDTVSVAGGGPLARMIDVELTDLNADDKLDVAVLVNDTGFVPPEDADKPGSLVLLIQGTDPRDPSDWTQVEPSGACYADPEQDGCDLLFASSATGVTDMAVGDFTNDQLPDIVVASNEPAEEDVPYTFVYLFPNPGAAGVTNATEWNRTIVEANVVEFSSLAVADIDSDGDLDVVASAPISKTWNLSWHRNSANGTAWDFGGVGQQQDGAEFIAAGDIDGDGYVDVAASSVQFALTQWFRNPGPTVVTTTQVPWEVFNIGEFDDDEAEINQVQLVDLDGDQQLDCFVTADGSAVGFRRQDDVEHLWDSFPITDTDPVAEIGRVDFADFDEDGQLDFIAPLNREGLTEDRIAIYTSVANSQWRRRLIGQQAGGANFIALGDVDGDGRVDVASSSMAETLTQWFRNPGPEALAVDAPQVPWYAFNIGVLDGGQINQVHLVDLNNDDLLDCLVTASGTVMAFMQTEDVEEAWDSFVITVTDPIAEIGLVSFADFGGDGRNDFVAPLDREGLMQDEVVIYTSVSGSVGYWARRLIGQQQGGGDFIAIGDVDSDGNVDVASSSVVHSLTQWFRNPGPELTTTTQVPWEVFNLGETAQLDSGSITQVQLVDLDGNGTLDCFLSAGGTGIGFERQTNVEDFWTPFVMFLTDPVAEIGRAGFGDFNEDGQLDFVVPLDREGLTKDQFVIFFH